MKICCSPALHVATGNAYLKNSQRSDGCAFRTFYCASPY